MLTPQRRRVLMIVLIMVILLSCTISAMLGLRGGHATRAAGTFFAGLSFSLLFWTRLGWNEEAPGLVPGAPTTALQAFFT